MARRHGHDRFCVRREPKSAAVFAKMGFQEPAGDANARLAEAAARFASCGVAVYSRRLDCWKSDREGARATESRVLSPVMPLTTKANGTLTPRNPRAIRSDFRWGLTSAKQAAARRDCGSGVTPPQIGSLEKLVLSTAVSFVLTAANWNCAAHFKASELAQWLLLRRGSRRRCCPPPA